MLTNPLPKNKLTLNDYLPPLAVEDVDSLITSQEVVIKVVPPRKTIAGSYRKTSKDNLPVITINNNLNPYRFLITFLHEWAHLLAAEQHKDRQHGFYWKQSFGLLLNQFLQKEVFPEEIKKALIEHLGKIKSSDFRDVNLSRALAAYDENEQNLKTLDQLPKNSVFLHDNKKWIIKGHLRKYILCKCLTNNKIYKIHPLVRVEFLFANN